MYYIDLVGGGEVEGGNIGGDESVEGVYRIR